MQQYRFWIVYFIFKFFNKKKIIIKKKIFVNNYFDDHGENQYSGTGFGFNDPELRIHKKCTNMYLFLRRCEKS